MTILGFLKIRCDFGPVAHPSCNSTTMHPFHYFKVVGACFGFLSILSWIFSAAPQVIKNFRRQSTEGFSIFFMSYWFLGDLTNLIGAIITGAVWTQILQAVYFCSMDTVLLLQFLLFNRHVWPRITAFIKRILRGSPSPAEDSDGDSRPLLDEVSLASLSPLLVLIGIHLTSHQRHDLGVAQGILGELIGYVSALCYLSSRVPQVYHNIKAHSVDGISPLMFVLAVCGNGTYVISIILSAPYEHGWSTVKSFFLREIPWILGSAGTFVFDFTIIIQCFYYILIRPRFVKPAAHEDEADLLEASEDEQAL
ncbi:PQ loop repeat [Carpediemonas membranifera]|uniref:PQ loop repeat n=1 Tax=Carpediemonas membranifera TaxID=201153 RepID=A0A8J6B2A1_9EUKA|nr:PQ loop repeat [Carpediemonas membranifera]|eukprot:KAG9396885.1 PQ loop repeat [Carpediemonas membranifera]